MNLLSKLKFDARGLIPVVVQDHKDNTVLMVAYMNKQSLKRTLRNGLACYWSRSRQRLWLKGESSGNVQKIKKIYFDCDGDCLIIVVKQVGDAACHTGHRSCFFREYKQDKIVVNGKPLFDPKKVYKSG